MSEAENPTVKENLTEPKTEPKKESFLRRLLRWLLWFLVIAYLIAGCAWLCARYWLAPYIEEQKTKIEHTISETVSAPVTFEDLNAGWEGFNPEITLKNIRLGDKDGPSITADSLTAKLSLRSLSSMEPIFDSVTLDKPVITVDRKGPMIFSALGKTFDLAQLLKGKTDLEKASSKLPSDILLLLKQRLLEISGGTVRIVDEKTGNVLEIKDINAVFESKAGEKRFAFTLTPPPEIASPVTVRAALKPPLLNASKLSNWDADLYARTDYVNFGEIAKWLPDFSVKYRGIGSGDLWASLTKWHLSSSTFIGALSDVHFALPNLKPLDLKYVKGKVSGAVTPESYSVSTEDFAFELQSGEISPPLNLNVQLQKNADNAVTGGSFKANLLEFKGLTAVVPSLPLPQGFKEFLLARKLKGNIDNVDVSWQGNSEMPLEYSGKLRINHFTSYGANGKNNTQWLPGFQNFSADIVMKNGNGSITFNTADAQVALPGLFPAAAFQLDKLTGVAEWSTREKLSVSFKDICFENPDAAACLNGKYFDDGSPFGFLDTDIALSRGNVASAWKYVPLIAGEDTIAWLRYGLLGGKAVSGTAKISGALHNFPFEGSATEKFEVSVNVEDVTLDVYPLKLDKPNAAAKAGAIWPVFKQVAGLVRFIGDEMHILADKGAYKNANLISAKVDIPSFSADTVWLEVDASAHGELPSFLNYVLTSPVDGYTGGVFKKAAATGDGSLRLELKIPLDGPGNVGVDGTFTLAGNNVNFNNFQIPDLQNVRGAVNFTDKGVDSNDLQAQCYGESVSATLATNKRGDILVKAKGSVPAKALPKIIPVELLSEISEHYLKGTTPFTADVTVGSKATNVEIRSSLKGLASDLPLPMTKAADVSAPLHIIVKDTNDTTDISVMIDGFVSSEVVVKNGDILKGAFGNKSLPSLPARGYSVSFDTPILSASAWTKVFDTLNREVKTPIKPADEIVSLPDIVSARISIGELLIDNFNQTNLNIRGRTAGNSLIAHVQSNEMNAQIEWKKAVKGKQQPEIIARISDLYIPESAENLAEDTKPVEVSGGWPAINAIVDNLTYGKRRLGKVELVARNTVAAKGHLWQIKKLNISNRDAVLKSSGSWLKGFDGVNETTLLLDNQVNNLGGLLTRLAMPNLIRNGYGTLKGQLSWEGTPLGFNTQSFDGHLTLNFKRGEILKIEPGAAAKLLSLLSLQSLTRYLTLDFRDFYSSGFTFTTIDGTADIDDGLMKIKDLTLVGSSATVIINGDINTQNETQNLKLLVLPDINAAGASAALAIANPIAGIGSFLAQLIFKDPLSKLFSFEYHVTGTWSDPIVKKTEGDHKL